MKLAPLTPTTEELHAQHPIDAITTQRVGDIRQHVSAVIQHGIGFIGIIGPCSMSEHSNAGSPGEAAAVRKLCESNNPTLYREPFWKPRTNPNDWWGHETTDPEGAYALARSLAQIGGYAAEIGHESHLGRYAQTMAFGWIGSRAVANAALLEKIARHDPMLPIGVKNGLDGTIDAALANVEEIERLRGSEGAPAVLIYRGGENAQNPGEWEDKYVEAHERTGGRLLVDTAHGSEMAHDRDGQFKKSVGGQTLCMNHLDELITDGYAPLGVLMEASNMPSRTDPVMPLARSLWGVKRLRRNAAERRAA